jgi:hypothetical protein
MTTMDTNVDSSAPGPFNASINSWAEGTLMSIDADGGKLSIRGAKRPYASMYAKMLKAIHEKTTKMTQAERATKAAEIRKSWVPVLEKANLQPVDADHDLTFHLPNKDRKLVVVDETAFYGRPSVPTGSTQSLTDSECDAVQAMKDLKIGECLVIGYQSGVLSNSAFTVIKANRFATH